MRAALLALTTVLIVALMPSAAPAAPDPTTTPTPQAPGDSPSLFDPGGWIRNAMSNWFADLLASSLRPVFDLLGRTVFSTPRIDGHDRVRELWKFSLGIADATLVIFLLAGAAAVTASGGLETALTAKELIPRLFVAALTANLSLLALGQMIELSNGLCRGVFGTIDPQAVGRRMAELLFSGSGLNPFVSIIGLVVVVLAVLVVVVYVVRIAVLVVLAAVAPLMLITHSLPQTDSWARMWWRGLIALLAVPVAQSFLLVAAFRVFLSGDGLLGLSGSGLIDLLVIGTILYLLFKIPLWALNASLGGAASATVGRAKTWAIRAAKAVIA